MACSALDIDGVTGAVSQKVTAVNLAACLAGAGLLYVFKGSYAPGFLIGAAIGALNIYWLLRIARRGMLLKPERAGRVVAISYHVRFVFVAAVFGVLISKGVLGPWPLLAGLTSTIFTTILTMIFLARGEATDA